MYVSQILTKDNLAGSLLGIFSNFYPLSSILPIIQHTYLPTILSPRQKDKTKLVFSA
jgi:hypothetical protein